MRTRSAQLTLTVICIFLGALLMMQFRTQGRLATASVAESATDQATIIANLANANDELRREAQSLAEQELEYQRSIERDDLTGVLAELNRLRVITGKAEVAGPGIELKIEWPIRAEEVQDTINELRNAGAEVIAVNGVRLTARSAVDIGKEKPVLDGQVLDLPIVFEAIGDPDALDRAVGRMGGMVSYLQSTYPKANITLTKRARLELAPTSVQPSLKVSESVP